MLYKRLNASIFKLERLLLGLQSNKLYLHSKVKTESLQRARNTAESTFSFLVNNIQNQDREKESLLREGQLLIRG